VRTETFKHVDQHDLFCANILKSRATEEDRETEDANDEDKKESVETRTFRHVD
jgi:hypothetical protein